jgi:hypothetical protein
MPFLAVPAARPTPDGAKTRGRWRSGVVILRAATLIECARCMGWLLTRAARLARDVAWTDGLGVAADWAPDRLALVDPTPIPELVGPWTTEVPAVLEDADVPAADRTGAGWGDGSGAGALLAVDAGAGCGAGSGEGEGPPARAAGTPSARGTRTASAARPPDLAITRAGETKDVILTPETDAPRSLVLLGAQQPIDLLSATPTGVDGQW